MNKVLVQLLCSSLVMDFVLSASISQEHTQLEQLVLDRLTWDHRSSISLSHHVSEVCILSINKITEFNYSFVPGAVDTSNVISKSLLHVLKYFQLFSKFKSKCVLQLDRVLNGVKSSLLPFRPVLASVILNNDFLAKHIRIETNIRKELQYIIDNEKIPIEIGKKYSKIYDGITELIRFYRSKTFEHFTETSQQKDYQNFTIQNKNRMDAFIEDFIVYYYFITCKSVFDIILFLFYYDHDKETNIKESTLILREFVKRTISTDKQEKLIKNVKENIKEFVLKIKSNYLDEVPDRHRLMSRYLTSESYVVVQECGDIIAKMVDILVDGFIDN